MNRTTQDQDQVRTDLANEALALLAMIDSADNDEDIDEDQASREARVMLRATAGRLVARIVAELRAPELQQQRPTSFFAAAA